MFDRILRRMQEKIRLREYVLTFHAEEEMTEEGLTIYHVEQGILSGVIHERQRETSTNEWKYCITGFTFSRKQIEIVAKLSLTGKLYIITVYTP